MQLVSKLNLSYTIFAYEILYMWILIQQTDPDGETAANTSNVSEDAVAATEGDHDPYFEPVVTLPEIQIKTNEEEEEEMVKL